MPRGHVVFENLFGEHGAIGELDLPACASFQRTPLEQLALGYSCDWSVREQGSFVGFVLRGELENRLACAGNGNGSGGGDCTRSYVS